jgi:hypothetical protein
MQHRNRTVETSKNASDFFHHDRRPIHSIADWEIMKEENYLNPQLSNLPAFELCLHV